jgi:hypothetical protein
MAFRACVFGLPKTLGFYTNKIPLSRFDHAGAAFFSGYSSIIFIFNNLNDEDGWGVVCRWSSL